MKTAKATSSLVQLLAALQVCPGPPNPESGQAAMLPGPEPAQRWSEHPALLLRGLGTHRAVVGAVQLGAQPGQGMPVLLTARPFCGGFPELPHH